MLLDVFWVELKLVTKEFITHNVLTIFYQLKDKLSRSAIFEDVPPF